MIEQGWEIALLTLDENVSMPMIKDFYHSLIGENFSWNQAKAGGVAFHLRAQHIVKYLHVLESGDETYFDNLRTTSFVEIYLSKKHMINIVLEPGIRFKNLVNLVDLIKIAFIF